MAGNEQRPVVILYEHALLGEGIATYLRVQLGVDTTAAWAHDHEAVKSALAPGPAVIIFESHAPFQQLDLALLAPHAVLIDVSTVITKGSIAPRGAGFAQILQTIRDSSSAVARPGDTHTAELRATESHTEVSPVAGTSATPAP